MTAPVPTVTGDLGLRCGTPCPVWAGAIFHLAAWVRQESWAIGAPAGDISSLFLQASLLQKLCELCN